MTEIFIKDPNLVNYAMATKYDSHLTPDIITYPHDMSKIPMYEEDGVEIKSLGSGGFGSVISISLKGYSDGVAVKAIPLTEKENDIKMIQEEIAVLTELSDTCTDYIICYYGAIFYPAQKYVYIIIDYDESYISLFDLLEAPYHMGREVQITENVINGLKLIHGMGISHNDIKPENILVNPGTGDIKYIDFGLSCFSKSTACVDRPLSGTQDYIAPERLTDGGIKSLDIDMERLQSADIWALGITLFNLATRRKPNSKFDLSVIVNPGEQQWWQYIIGPMVQVSIFDRMMRVIVRPENLFVG